MIYEIFIGLLIFCLVLYYIFCFLELLGIIKFTDKDTEMSVSKAFIPFYYIFKTK